MYSSLELNVFQSGFVREAWRNLCEASRFTRGLCQSASYISVTLVKAVYELFWVQRQFSCYY